MSSQASDDPHAVTATQPAAESTPFAANAMRLSLTQLCLSVLVVCSTLYAIPRLWQRWEPLQSTGDNRIPYSLSEDYWFYNRHLQSLANENQIVVLGDSVMWGEYVQRDETLSHFLSERSPDRHF